MAQFLSTKKLPFLEKMSLEDSRDFYSDRTFSNILFFSLTYILSSDMATVVKPLGKPRFGLQLGHSEYISRVCTSAVDVLLPWTEWIISSASLGTKRNGLIRPCESFHYAIRSVF